MLAGVVLGGALVASVLQVRTDSVAIRLWAPRRVISEGQQEQIDLINSMVPTGAALLYIGDMRNGNDRWQAGFWQRILYPSHAVFAVSRSGVDGSDVRKIRHKYHIFYALSAGTPPADPGFLWKVVLPPAVPAISVGPVLPIILGQFGPEDSDRWGER
jgi:hypothetical protein